MSSKPSENPPEEIGKGYGHHHHSAPGSNITIAFLLNLSFTIIEFIGGYWTNSIAITADALHDLGDTFALGSALYLEKVARKKRDQTFSYGYRRFSLLAAILTGGILIAGSAIILTQAIPRIWDPQASNTEGMAMLALLGIIFNGLGALRLGTGRTMNERMLTWHFIEDILGWVAVLIVSGVMYFFDLPILDPILASVFTLVVLWNVLKNSRETVMIFLQSVPASVDIKKLETEVQNMSDIHSLHDTHIWSMDGDFHVLTTHAVIENRVPDRNILKVKQKVRSLIENHGIDHATIEIERVNEQCHLKSC